MTSLEATTPGLHVTRADVSFGGRPGLRDVSLAVQRGTRTVLLGPSGVGKTSLLRAIAGLGGLSAGVVQVDGRDVSSEPTERRGIVYLHQTPGLFPHLSVLDNVAFPLEVRGLSRPEARRRAGELLDRVRLTAFASRSSTALSGGQRHRVALARALAAAPAALLLDEPFSALDPELRADVRAAVVELLAEPTGPAVVLVTHDIDEASSLAHHLVVLMDGRVAQRGSPAEVLGRPCSLGVARFIGLANVIPGSRDGAGNVSCPLGVTRADGLAGPVAIVVRTAAVRVRAHQDDGPGGIVVDVIETVAGVTVRVQVGGTEVLGVADVGVEVTRGSRVGLVIDRAAMHVIDLLPGEA